MVPIFSRVASTCWRVPNSVALVSSPRSTSCSCAAAFSVSHRTLCSAAAIDCASSARCCATYSDSSATPSPPNSTSMRCCSRRAASVAFACCTWFASSGCSRRATTCPSLHDVAAGDRDVGDAAAARRDDLEHAAALHEDADAGDGLRDAAREPPCRGRREHGAHGEQRDPAARVGDLHELVELLGRREAVERDFAEDGGLAHGVLRGGLRRAAVARSTARVTRSATLDAAAPRSSRIGAAAATSSGARSPAAKRSAASAPA